MTAVEMDSNRHLCDVGQEHKKHRNLHDSDHSVESLETLERKCSNLLNVFPVFRVQDKAETGEFGVQIISNSRATYLATCRGILCS